MRLPLAIRLATLPLALVTPFAACVADDGGEDGESPDGIDEVAVGDGKADGQLTDCETKQLLGYLNNGVSADALLEAGVHRRAARNLTTYRDGIDGVYSTGDDNTFDTLAEVDGVSYVGPTAFAQMTAVTSPRCVPLTLTGTCRTTVMTFYNGLGTPRSEEEQSSLDIRLDPIGTPNAPGAANGDRVPTSGTALVSSAWDSTLPSGLWRAWCNYSQSRFHAPTDACSTAAFELSTRMLGVGGGAVSYLMESPTEYTLIVSGAVEHGKELASDRDYTSERWWCTLATAR